MAGKQPAPQWLTMDEALKHCEAGLGIWEWASNDRGAEPDVVMACCGDVPTLETLAAVDLLRHHMPELKVRVINVVDLMTLQPRSEHPHGMPDADFDALFTTDKPIIFAFHGYPWLIHRLTYRRNGHRNLHVRGYKEEGTTSTPFDMCVMNDIDRFHLVGDVIDRVPKAGARAAYAKQAIRDKLIEHKQYIARYGDDMPEIANWSWGQRPPRGARRRARARPRPTTSDRGERDERIRDPARRDRLEPQRPAHRHDRHPADRQRAPSRRAAASRARQRELCVSSLSARCSAPAKRAIWSGSASRAVVEPDLMEWNYGEYEGITTAQIQQSRPGWQIFNDGCPGGETPEQIGARVDRVIARVRTAYGDVALFAHGHVLRVLVARWIGLPAGSGQHFLLDTGTLCVLGDYRGVPAVKVWNGPIAV